MIPKGNEWRLCQARYFAGIKVLVHGNKADAISQLQKALATKTTRAMEYRLTAAELKFLGQ